MFNLSERDVGRPLRDLEVSFRPVELRGYLEQARGERRAIRIKEIEWQRGPAESLWLEIHVNPLVTLENRLLGVSIVFHDVTSARRLLSELEHAHRQLETVYEELQSTNEELETMNEELQSANDEMQTINEALRERSAEVDELNSFLESILTSLRAAVVVVDADMRVLAWNRGSEELWGLRREEAEGQHLLNLDIGLPPAEIRPHVRHVLADASFADSMLVQAVNRRGREISVHIVCGALRQSDGKPAGAILVMDVADDGAAR